MGLRRTLTIFVIGPPVILVLTVFAVVLGLAFVLLKRTFMEKPILNAAADVGAAGGWILHVCAGPKR